MGLFLLASCLQHLWRSVSSLTDYYDHTLPNRERLWRNVIFCASMCHSNDVIFSHTTRQLVPVTGPTEATKVSHRLEHSRCNCSAAEFDRRSSPRKTGANYICLSRSLPAELNDHQPHEISELLNWNKSTITEVSSCNLILVWCWLIKRLLAIAIE